MFTRAGKKSAALRFNESSAMKNTFTRQKSGSAKVGDLKINLRANAKQVPRVVEPGHYQLRIDSARAVGSSRGNVSIVIDATEPESEALVDIQPLWISGPNGNNGRLAAANQLLLAQLFELAGVDANSDIALAEELPKLEGLVFEARLELITNASSGRVYNSLAAIFMDDAS
jgi:hypothetical protein